MKTSQLYDKDLLNKCEHELDCAQGELAYHVSNLMIHPMNEWVLKQYAPGVLKWSNKIIRLIKVRNRIETYMYGAPLRHW